MYLSMQCRHTWGVKVQHHAFLNSVLDGSKWSASFPSHLSSGSKPHTHQIGGWVAPRAGLGILEKGKISCLPGFKPTIIQPAT